MQGIDLDDIKPVRPKQLSEVLHIKNQFTHIIKRMGQKPEEVSGFPHSEWLGFNKHFGGSRGELITVTADTGVGKSTFVRNWVLDTVTQGRKALLMSLEDPMGQVTECFAQMISGKDILLFNDADASKVGKKLAEMPLYYLDHQGPLKESQATQVIDYAVDEFGVNFIVLDHLDYIEKDWHNRNESYVIGDTMRKLAGKAHSLNVTIVLIVHPAKTNVKGNLIREIGLDELKGSSSIKQESDAVFGIFRPDPQVAMAYLRFLKIRNHRYSKSVQGKIKFGFDPQSLSWWEVNGELEWDRADNNRR